MTKHSFRGSELSDDDRREKDDKLLVCDTTYTFRVNEKLKADFKKLCRKERYSVGAALRRYMLRCVAKGEVTHDFRKLNEFDTKVKFRRR